MPIAAPETEDQPRRSPAELLARRAAPPEEQKLNVITLVAFCIATAVFVIGSLIQ
jgi:hypothetical protein